MKSIISRKTKLENKHHAPIVVRAMKNGFIVEKFNVTIPPGGYKYVYHSDLCVEYNYSPVFVNAFLKGAEEKDRIPVLTSVVRDNEVIEFDFKDGTVTVNPIKGRLLARIGLFKWFVSRKVSAA